MGKYLGKLAYALTFLSCASACAGSVDTERHTTDGDSTGGDGGSTGGSHDGGSAGGSAPASGGSAAGGAPVCDGVAPGSHWTGDYESCSVCRDVVEVEPFIFDSNQVLCHNEGFQLRRTFLGCGFLRLDWSGDVGDYGHRTLRLVEGEGGAGGAVSEDGLYEVIDWGDWYYNGETCRYVLYGDEVPTCDSWEEICKDY